MRWADRYWVDNTSTYACGSTFANIYMAWSTSCPFGCFNHCPDALAEGFGHVGP